MPSAVLSDAVCAMHDEASPVYQMTLPACALPTAAAAADRLDGAVEPEAVSVSLFERSAGLHEVTALYAHMPDRAALHALLQPVLGEAGIAAMSIAPLPDADWVTLSQGQRGRVVAGRFTIHGSHEPVRAGAGTIEIDAGRAFGTAHHETTKACLLALDEILKCEQPERVIDIGTGSGVLAIAAARFTHGPVLAVDDDPIAIEVARENAIKNRTRRIRFAVSDGFKSPLLRGVEADLIFGNLLQSILLRLAPDFARHSALGGLVVLSGLTNEQAPRVEARFCSLGYAVVRRITIGDWTSLVLRYLALGTRPRSD